MQKESLTFFAVNGFYSFLSADEEYLAFCHIKTINQKSFNIFQLIDRLDGGEKLWIKENEFFYSLKSLLNAYPDITGERGLSIVTKNREHSKK